MTTPAQPRPPTAKIAIAVCGELGWVPAQAEVERVVLRTLGRGQAVLERPDRRKEQQQTGQLTLV